LKRIIRSLKRSERNAATKRFNEEMNEWRRSKPWKTKTQKGDA
jgi:hypothetical protein